MTLKNNMEYRPGLSAPAILRRVHRRVRTQDVAYSYRMGAGFAGMVTRTHPVSIEPTILDATNPPTFYGEAVLVNTSANTVRQPITTDTGITLIYGITVRPYPLQASSGDASYGQANFSTSSNFPALQAGQVVDILRSGYIMVPVNVTNGSPTKGGAVYLWVAASGTGHTQGAFEGGASGGNTASLSGYPGTVTFNGPVDTSTGLVELAFNI